MFVLRSTGSRTRRYAPGCSVPAAAQRTTAAAGARCERCSVERALTCTAQVAIKVMKKKIKSARLSKLIRREVALLQLLDHPNIIRLLDVIVADETFNLVMQYVDGGELFYRIQRKPLSERHMRHYFRQVRAPMAGHWPDAWHRATAALTRRTARRSSMHWTIASDTIYRTVI